MQKKPPAKPKPRRKAPPPKAGAGREGGLRAKGNLSRPPFAAKRNPSATNVARDQQHRLRRANAAAKRPEGQTSSSRSDRPVSRRFTSETQENSMTKLAQMRRSNFSGQPRRRPRVSK